MSEQKATLRDQARKHRASIQVSADDAERASEHFFTLFPESQSRIISAYWPKGREFDPIHLLEEAHKIGFACALPYVEEGSKALKFYRWQPGDILENGQYDILHPAVRSPDTEVLPDIVVVPLLAFDRRGYRLGQGGGYYDTTLEALRAQKDIIAIGLGYATQAVLFNLPVEPHDQKLDYVITPEGVQSF